MTRPRAFSLVELVFTLVISAVLLAALVDAAGRSRRAAGVQGSIDRLRRITGAAQVYHLDHAGQVPFRGSQYNFGQLSGWDTSSFGGKDSDVYWQSTQSGLFDESAYSRTLNPYLNAVPLAVPTGYVNTGSGSTWTFSHGHPSSQERTSFQLEVFHSPGDLHSYSGGAYTISSYNDVGTSYQLNMAWWNDPTLPFNFTQKYNEGTQRIGLDFSGANPNFVWAGDQGVNIVPAGPPAQWPGEWHKPNASVVAFADGRVLYILLRRGAHSGPGYTLWP